MQRHLVASKFDIVRGESYVDVPALPADLRQMRAALIARDIQVLTRQLNDIRADAQQNDRPQLLVQYKGHNIIASRGKRYAVAFGTSVDWRDEIRLHTNPSMIAEITISRLYQAIDDAILTASLNNERT